MSRQLEGIRSLGYRTDLMLLSLGGSQIEQTGDHLVIRTPHNLTFWWGNFLLYDRPPASGEIADWQADFRTAFPEARHMAFGIDAAMGQLEGAAPEFKAAGFELAPSTVMTAGQADLRPPERPNLQAEYRRLNGDDDWAQALALRLDCNEDLEAASYRLYAGRKAQEARRLAEAGHGGWFGAFVNGRMEAGMGLYTDGSGIARFQSVETRPSARHRGLASSLVHFVARLGFEAMSAHTLVMWPTRIIWRSGFTAPWAFRTARRSLPSRSRHQVSDFKSLDGPFPPSHTRRPPPSAKGSARRRSP